MGSYLNPGGGMFKACLRSKIYVDKSGLNRAAFCLREQTETIWKIHGCQYAGCILWQRGR